MIGFEEFQLANGLKVIVHEDHTIPTAVVNLLYDVGSRDEDPSKTGFAHLFEHLMFGGSTHIHDFDGGLQRVGGNNNAFTSPDITNYYITLPAANLETAFWLESDRMLSLSFHPEVLEVQRKVVIEEFKQRYINQPYGDIWHLLRPAAYKVHPYQWPTIGAEIAHIQDATLEDVKSFFFRHYLPNNAILVVAGQVNTDHVFRLAEKWFGDIPAGTVPVRNLPQELPQTERIQLEVTAKVPVDAIYRCYKTCGRNHPDYYATDLASDLLGRGKSSRLYEELVVQQKLFSSISAYVSGSIDPGLLTISGKLNQGVSIEKADKAIDEVIDSLLQEPVDEKEIQKVKNQAEATIAFTEMEVLNRAMNLAFFKLLGNPDQLNQEAAHIQQVSKEQLLRTAQDVLSANNCTTLYYRAQND